MGHERQDVLVAPGGGWERCSRRWHSREVFKEEAGLDAPVRGQSPPEVAVIFRGQSFLKGPVPTARLQRPLSAPARPQQRVRTYFLRRKKRQISADLWSAELSGLTSECSAQS